MMRERGSLELAMAVLLVAALSCIGAYFLGKHDGRKIERADWQGKQVQELVAANAEIQRLNSVARERERAGGLLMNTISRDYQRKLQDARTRQDADRVAVSTGAVVLRDPGAGGCAPASGVREAAAGAGGRDAAPSGGLSQEASRFLFDLANSADEVAGQLDRCQAVVRADREIVNGVAK